MPPVCSICSHPERRAIDAALAAGTPMRSIAFRFGTTHTTLRRHRAHVSEAVAEAAERRSRDLAADLLRDLDELCAQAAALYQDAGRSFHRKVEAVHARGRVVSIMARLVSADRLAAAIAPPELRRRSSA
jgi:hypothetical protein